MGRDGVGAGEVRLGVSSFSLGFRPTAIISRDTDGSRDPLSVSTSLLSTSVSVMPSRTCHCVFDI